MRVAGQGALSVAQFPNMRVASQEQWVPLGFLTWAPLVTEKCVRLIINAYQYDSGFHLQRNIFKLICNSVTVPGSNVDDSACMLKSDGSERTASCRWWWPMFVYTQRQCVGDVVSHTQTVSISNYHCQFPIGTASTWELMQWRAKTCGYPR